ncbi:hypothetical protein ACHAW5_009545 [Stephanodiscus triporus]|uniref:Serine/threonine-protein phosphatase PGAM5, mitochondrial n=1 Tax=Stephanodiscus triporus TaxID=2934178 RepID=A0ABD3NF41_9STRA
MARTFYRFARSSLPAATTALAASTFFDEKDGRDDDDRFRLGGGGSSARHARARAYSHRPRATLCEVPHRHPSRDRDAAYRPSDPAEPAAGGADADGRGKGRAEGGGMGMWGEERDGSFHGLFPRRQLWRPALEYPLWDYNWDGRQPTPIGRVGGEEGGDDSRLMAEARRERLIRKEGVTRHIILVRHGQYDETYKEDSRRLLTPIGRKQAELTGQRLGKLIRGVNEQFGPCRVRVVRVSDLARAKETADIIYESMDLERVDGENVIKAKPDPMLNEGRTRLSSNFHARPRRPCHHIPGGIAGPSVVERTDEQHPRIEEAFRKYFYRAEVPGTPTEGGGGDCDVGLDAPARGTSNGEDETPRKLVPHPQHEFEVIVCHANVIRYFFCRALQLPPEAWLRLCTFNCSLTYFTIRPTGTVSCRMLGDIGHLPYELCTFSMHSGFNW